MLVADVASDGGQRRYRDVVIRRANAL